MNTKILVISILAGALLSPLFPETNVKKANPPLSLHQVSLFLSGKAIDNPPESLATLLKTYPYKSFRHTMSRYWTAYLTNEAVPIGEWREKWLTNADPATCFYPFGGPDFLNAYQFYPKANLYILIGLEKAGLVPDIANMDGTKIEQGLAMTAQGFRFIMRKNFYRTLDMMKDLDQSPFTGTVPHILCQMGWLGLKPVAAYRVDLDKGELAYTPLNPAVPHSRIAIEFEDKDGSLKKVIYMRMNLRDEELVSRPGWLKFLADMGPVSGILKAASYLMHKQTFTNIRAICLKNMRTLVGDDSGIPYRYFTAGWDVTLFGRYTGPIKLFATRLQNDLVSAYSNAAHRPLKFRYSYNPDDGTRNMLLARKRAPADKTAP